jgi:hypothetical protein
MTQLTTITAGMTPTTFINAINNNFAFLNLIVSDAASIDVVTKEMDSLTLLNKVNGNFSNLNEEAAHPIELNTFILGMSGSELNAYFAIMNLSLGKGLNTDNLLFQCDVIVSPHIVAVNGSKILKFNDADTLSLSLDSGVTYSITKVLSGISVIDYGFIFDNGNILFCSPTKCYYSTDNLSTYQESTTLGIDGQTFVPGTLCNFMPFSCELKEITVNGVKLHTWGAYVNAGTAEYVNINQWYTIDQGVTVKSGFKVGVSLPVINVRHIHFIKYDQFTNIFWMATGDIIGDVINNYILNGTYNTETDQWTWVVFGYKPYDESAFYPIAGIAFDINYLYVCVEGPLEGVMNEGVWRILKSDLINYDTHLEKILNVETTSMGLVKYNQDWIVSNGWTNQLSFSKNGINWKTTTFPQLTTLEVWGGYICLGVLDNGDYLFQCVEVGETVYNYAKGATLLIKWDIN